VLTSELTNELKAFCASQRITVNTLVQASWALLLSQRIERRCVAFGTTLAGRPLDLPDVERQVGLFINTVPLVVEVSADATLGEWLVRLQEQNLGIRQHGHYPLPQILSLYPGEREIFDTVVIFENYPVAEILSGTESTGLRFGAAHYHEQTHYPLTLYVTLADTLTLNLSYKPCFVQTAVDELLQQLRALLLRMVHTGTQGRLDELVPGVPPVIPDRPVSARSETAIVPCPADVNQRKWLDIWAQVLEVERVELDDDFFSLGGNSFKAMWCVARMNSLGIPGWQVDLKSLFEKPTVRSLTAALERIQGVASLTT